MVERLVVCGGLPVPKGRRAAEVLELDVNAACGSTKRVNLKLHDLTTRMVEDVPPVLADLLEIAVYVYCADQFTGRGGDTMPGMGRD